MTLVRIIDGKRYDTSKATEVATWTNGFDPTAFKYQEKILFRSVLRKEIGSFLMTVDQSLTPPSILSETSILNIATSTSSTLTRLANFWKNGMK